MKGNNISMSIDMRHLSEKYQNVENVKKVFMMTSFLKYNLLTDSLRDK